MSPVNHYENFIFKFEKNEQNPIENSITLTQYIGTDPQIILPSHINQIPVTVLDRSLFADFFPLESVVLPETLEKIEDCCFSNCEKLQSIQFPPSLTSIGKRAFQRCSSLEELIFPDSLTSINNESFRNCSGLKRIYFQKSLVKMGEQSFHSCTSLREVHTHPDFVFRDRNHFSGCKNLWNQDGLVIINKMFLAYYGEGENLTIPEGVIHLPAFFCADKKNLKNLTLPSTLETIGEGAFMNCVNLTQAILPPKIKILPHRCFHDCNSLRKVVLPDDCQVIESSCFRNCKSLTDLVWTDKLERICENAFHKSSIEQLPSLPHLECVERNAFSSCPELRHVAFSAALKVLGDAVFHFSINLKTIIFSHKDEEIEKSINQGKTNGKTVIPYNQNLKSVPNPVVDSWAVTHQNRFRLHQFLHWEELDAYSKDYFYKNWRLSTENNPVVDSIFLEGTGKEMHLYLELGFSLTLPQTDEYLDHSISHQKTVETALLLDYKRNHFTKEEISDYETEKEMIEMGVLLPTLSQFQKKWNISQNEEGILIKNSIGNSEEEFLPDTTKEGIPILYAKYQILKDLSLFPPLKRILFTTGEEIELVNDDFTSTVHCTSTIKELEFPPDISIISQKFGSNMAHLEKIILPYRVLAIEDYAFSNCPKLKTVLFLVKPMHVASTAFRHCPSLEFFGTHLGENFLDVFFH